jgi:hypothetical protein
MPHIYCRFRERAIEFGGLRRDVRNWVVAEGGNCIVFTRDLGRLANYLGLMMEMVPLCAAVLSGMGCSA